MSRSTADRNLLFGVLALQMDFISREALIAAVGAWVLDKARPIGEILVQQGTLSPGRRAMLEPLVEEHVKSHGDDPGRSLASVGSLGSARDDLEKFADPDVEASLARVVPAATGAADVTYATRVPPVGTASSSGLRFRIVRPHDRGGLGVVSVALDDELHREVALKELQERFADDPEKQARFLLEAEVTGRLEHPGIVPVYGLGHYADGRPFYAMRFVRGDSLKHAIARFHRPTSPQGDAGGRRLRLRELLGRFVDVCDAVAYAHSRGVLHRDLKPGNIMLGPYGETLVVDWGLAKTSDAAGLHPGSTEPILRPESAGTAAVTMIGSAVGTPAYMSPEQAEGRLDRLGPASDVYGLGATLYHLLTGRPPFTDPEIGPLVEAVIRGEFPAPRRANPAVPPALEAICLKAMALDPDARYASPADLAEDLEHWMADEPVSVYRDPPARRLIRWAGRHQWAASTATYAIPLVLMAALLVAVQQRRRAAEAVAARAASEAEHARQRAALSAKYAQFGRAQQARRDRRPGWTAVGLAALAEAAGGPPGPPHPADLRREAAEYLAATDLGPAEPFGDALEFKHAPVNDPAFDQEGGRLVVAQGVPSAVGTYGGSFRLQSGRVAVFDARAGRALFRLQWPAGRAPGRSLLGGVLRGATGDDRAHVAAISPDGRWVAIGTEAGGIHLWDLASPEPDRGRVGWSAHPYCVRGLAFAGDSASLVSSADDQAICRWPLPAPRDGPVVPLVRARPPGHIGRLVARPGGRFLGGSGSVLREFVGPGLVPREYGLDLSAYRPEVFDLGPDGESVVSVSESGPEILARDGAGGPRTLREPGRVRVRPGATAVQFHPDGSLVLEVSSDARLDRGVRLWEVASGRPVAEMSVPGDEPIRASFTPDGRRLVVTERRGEAWRLISYEIRRPRALAGLAQAARPIRDAALAPDGKSLACLSDDWVPGLAGHRVEASLWGVPDGRPLGRQRFDVAHGDPTIERPGIGFRPDGGQVAFTGSHPEFFTWDIESRGEVRRLPAGGGRPIAAFSGDGRLWGLTRASRPPAPAFDQLVLIRPGTAEPVESIWRADRSTLVNGSAGLSGVVGDAGMVLVGTSWGTVEVFREATEEGSRSQTTWAIRVDDAVTTLALAPGGGLAAVGTQSGAIHLRRVPGGEVVGIIGEAHDRGLTSLAFAPDGRTLASGSSDGAARIWRLDVTGPRDPLTLPAPGGPVHSLAFTPDGDGLLMLIEGEHAVRIWGLGRLRSALDELGLPWPTVGAGPPGL